MPVESINNPNKIIKSPEKNMNLAAAEFLAKVNKSPVETAKNPTVYIYNWVASLLLQKVYKQ